MEYRLLLVRKWNASYRNKQLKDHWKQQLEQACILRTTKCKYKCYTYGNLCKTWKFNANLTIVVFQWTIAFVFSFTVGRNHKTLRVTNGNPLITYLILKFRLIWVNINDWLTAAVTKIPIGCVRMLMHCLWCLATNTMLSRYLSFSNVKSPAIKI